MICPHWQYLVTLDSDLKQVSRYVEITRDNFSTFSIEFVRLLLSAGSEIDVVAKILCEKIDPSKDYERGNINVYRSTILGSLPNFHSAVIDIPQSPLELKPWEDWGQNLTPCWWTIHNKVKHQRDRYYQHANLKNTIYAIAGLWRRS